MVGKTDRWTDKNIYDNILQSNFGNCVALKDMHI